MSLISKYVYINLNCSTAKYYEDKGYKFEYSYKNGKKNLINKKTKIYIDDLNKNSPAVVKAQCDMCGRISEMDYRGYLRRRKDDGKYYCKNCKSVKKNLYDACKEINGLYIFENWNYEKNGSPKKYGETSTKKVYVICENGKHDDYTLEAREFLYRAQRKSDIYCRICLSFKCWCDENKGLNFLDEKNFYELNEIKPEELKIKSTKHIYLYCKKHGVYKTSPLSVYRGKECQKCYFENTKDDYRLKTRMYPEYYHFSREVKEKYNDRCFIDNKNHEKMAIHHLNGYRWCKTGRTDVKNGILLSYEMHKKYHYMFGNKNNTREQFYEFLSILKEQGVITQEQLETKINFLKGDLNE